MVEKRKGGREGQREEWTEVGRANERQETA